jgi:hypothetical protein
MDEWLETVANVATGGLYEVGGTIYKSAKAAQSVAETVSEDVQKIADEAALALDQLFRSINASAFEIAEFTKGINELDKLDRPDGRLDSELWPEELKRKSDLKDTLAWLSSAAQTDQDSIDYMKAHVVYPDRMEALKKDLYRINLKIELVRHEIYAIVYKEPGPIPIAAHFAGEAVERFNTLEQPRLEDILDSANDSLEETHGLVQDVRKLLWVKQRRPKNSLSEQEKATEQTLRQASENYQLLAECGNRLHLQLVANFSQAFPPASPAVPPEPTGADNMQVTPGPTGPVNLPVTPEPATPPVNSAATAPGATSNFVGIVKNVSRQNFVESLQRYYQLRQQRVENAIQSIKTEEVEVPGVVTAAIDEVRKGMVIFNTQQQPRLETILDSVNQTVVESQKTMKEAEAAIAQARTSLGLFQSLLTNRWIKIGAIAFAGLFGLILLFSTIALFRVAFGI